MIDEIVRDSEEDKMVQLNEVDSNEEDTSSLMDENDEGVQLIPEESHNKQETLESEGSISSFKCV